MKKLSHTLVCLLLCIVFACYSLCLTFVEPSIQTSANQTQVKLPIIMYHLVLQDETRWGKFIIPPSLFESDIDYLLKKGYTPVNFSDVKNYVLNGKALPEKPIMITFDDGYYNNYHYIYPIVKEKNIKIVLSIIGSQAQKYTENGDKNPNYAHCTWEELKEMSESNLVEIQNHSYDLHTFTEFRQGVSKNKSESNDVYKKLLYSDFVNNHTMIENKVGKAPEAFTFPFGIMSSQAHDIIKDIGYLGSFSCVEGINHITNSPDCLYKLKRYNRPYGVSSEKYFADKTE